MKLSRRNDNGVWMVTFYVDGKRKRLSTGERNKKLAEERARELIAAHETHGNAVPRAGAMTVADALERTAHEVWQHNKAWVNQRSMMKHVKKDLGHLLITDVTHGKLLEFVETLKKRGNKPATINRKLSMLSKALNMASCWEDPETGKPYLLHVPVIPNQREDNKKDRFVTREEELRIIELCDEKARVTLNAKWWLLGRLVMFLVDTGCRLSEALNMRPDDLEDDKVTIHCTQSKNGRTRSVPLTLRLQKELRDMQRGPFGDRLFGSYDRWRVHKYFKQIKDEFPAIQDVTLHTFRHTCASRLVQAGVPLYTVAQWLGHQDTKVTQRYAHLSPDNLKDAVEHLNEPGLRLVK